MKEIWSGFLRAIGAFVATSGITLLGIWLFPLRRWFGDWFGGRATAGRIDLTIFLFVSTTVLLGLLIWSRISYSRFRMRVYEKKVTDDELQPEMMKHVFRHLKASEEKFDPKLGFFDTVLNWLMKR
jgi:hypothetical protein